MDLQIEDVLESVISNDARFSNEKLPRGKYFKSQEFFRWLVTA